tara:strand:+ start:66 stop:347 length:282 start_codon:yes stop_codon:yes gene_type:complete
MKFIALVLFFGANQAISLERNHHHHQQDNVNIMSNVDLNNRLNARAWSRLGLKSHAREIDELNDATDRLNKLVGDADTDPEANDQAVALISKL